MNALNAAIRDIPRPAGVSRLQVDARGFVVPWFVDCGRTAKPDHRVIDGRKFLRAVASSAAGSAAASWGG